VILLDTNVVSALMLQRPEPAVVAWLDQVDPRQVWLPSVVVFELRYGAALHPDATRRRTLEHSLRHFSDTGLSLINSFPEPPSQ
jgi:predicted nucleic acid-binding protein